MNKRYEIDQTVVIDGENWRVTSITETFYIVTRSTVEGEPTSYHDIRQLPRECEK